MLGLGEGMFGRIAVLLAAAATVSMFASGSALADDDEFARKGVYVAAGGLAAIENFGEDESDDLVAGGFDLRAGYRANEILSLETEFAYAGKWLIPAEAPDADGELNIWTWSLNVKANVPLGRISPYGVFGVGMHRSRADRGRDSSPPGQENIDAMFKGGIGVDFYVTRHIVLTPEVYYSANVDGKDNLDFIGFVAMATYRF